MYGDSLVHHGILGQKWGVRRYQNEDGSLTPEGRKRYGKELERRRRVSNAHKTEAAYIDTYRPLGTAASSAMVGASSIVLGGAAGLSGAPLVIPAVVASVSMGAISEGTYRAGAKIERLLAAQQDKKIAEIEKMLK